MSETRDIDVAIDRLDEGTSSEVTGIARTSCSRQSAASKRNDDAR